MTNIPTQAEQEALALATGWTIGGERTTHYWVNPDGIADGFPNFLSTDVLFKHVVPHIGNWEMDNDNDPLITVNLQSGGYAKEESPGLALFWACYRLLVEGEE